MSQRSDTGQWSNTSGPPRGEGKKHAQGKTPPRDEDGAVPPSSAGPDAVPEAELPRWFAHFRAEMRNNVLVNDSHLERAFSQRLLAYEEEQQRHICELEQRVATIRAAQDAATATHKQLWDQIARLDKALTFAETAAVDPTAAVRARTRPPSS